MLGWLLPLVLLLVFLAGLRYGADTRDGRDWHPYAGDRMAADRPTHRRAGSPRRTFATLGRLLRRTGLGLVEFHRSQVDLWERYLRAQRPWEAERLRWVRTADGWRLAGRVAPPAPRSGGIRPTRHAASTSAPAARKATCRDTPC